MTLEYAMLFQTDEDGNINVSFPDLPGCNTWGRDEDEAVEYAIEALQAHANEMMRQDKRMPDPSKCELKTLKVRMIELNATNKKAE